MGTSFLSTKEAAERLKVGTSTIHRWVSEERLKPAIRGTGIRGAMFFAAADIDALTSEDVAS